MGVVYLLLSVLNSGMSFSQILVEIIIRIPAVILAISFHESAHAWMAYKCGDLTAKMMGRISMNPARHFDLLGMLSMLLVGFGWAKPVNINPRNFKKFRRDTALVALAGPVSNFIMAAAAMLVYFIIGVTVSFFTLGDVAYQIVEIAMRMIYMVGLLNVSLMVFNLVPVPPLDGSKVLFSFLPAKSFNFVLTYERYGFLILFILLMTGILDIPLSMVMNFVLNLLYDGYYWLFSIVGLL